MSFYQKYRSEKIEDLDLTSVRSVFETMMKSGEISHAYLFVGPRGLGKTSAARILARLVNCEKNKNSRIQESKNLRGHESKNLRMKLVEPCNECENCVSIKNGSAVDVMEIDAASHRGIDDIRDLRDKVNLAPSVLSTKVYIIDEVHMLTTEAFNALLKTLEEPPSQVMFILCTTEAHKVPETIASRCVKIKFAKATQAELVRSLERAVVGEKIKVGKGVLEELASGLDGSFREGHKLLEQLANGNKEITVDAVRSVLNSVGSSEVEDILMTVRTGETKRLVTLMEELEANGTDVISLVTKLLQSLKNSVRKAIEDGYGPAPIDSRLIKRLVKVVPKIKTSPIPLLPLELLLEEMALRKKTGSGSQPRSGGVSSTRKSEVSPAVAGSRVLESQKTETQDKHDKIVSAVGFEQVVSGWHDLLSRLAPRNHSVAGLLRSAKPKELNDKFLTIEVFYKFHKDQLDQEPRRKMIEEEIAKMWGPISVKCVLSDKSRITNHESRITNRDDGVAGVKNDDGVKAAEEVFGI